MAKDFWGRAISEGEEMLMFGKRLYQEEALLREIVRTIDKKLEYTAREGDGSHFSLHVKLRNHEGDISLDLDELKAAKTDTVKRHQIRQKN